MSRWLPVLLAALGATLIGCASRRVPAAFPRSSAASEQADEAPAAEVTASLADETTPEQPAGAPDHHHHHGGGHHDR